MNEKQKLEPLKPIPAIQRVTWNESSLKRTKSFAEEVADALCLRAATIGNSYPSVAEGLIHVAEALRKARKDEKQESKTEIDIYDNSKAGDIPPGVPPRIYRTPTKELKTILKKPKETLRCLPVSLKDNSAESSEIIDGDVFKIDPLPVMPETFKECTAIHTRLTIDKGDIRKENGHSVVHTRVPSRKSSQYEPLNNIEHQIPSSNISPKRTASIKLISKKRRDALRGYIQSKLRNRSRSESRFSSGSKSGSDLNRNRVKTVRKRLQGAFNSSIQSTEGTFNRIKAYVMSSVKKENDQDQTQQT